MILIRALGSAVLCVFGLAACVSSPAEQSEAVQSAALTTYNANPAGLTDGRLAPCGPVRCITSDAIVAPANGIEPFRFPEQSPEYVWFSLRESVIALHGKITKDSTLYMAAEFVIEGGYIDDLEIRVDWNKRVLHWRSTSRVGDEQFNVLRERLELLRTALTARLSHPR